MNESPTRPEMASHWQECEKEQAEPATGTSWGEATGARGPGRPLEEPTAKGDLKGQWQKGIWGRGWQMRSCDG